jgi:hypothetical protein
MSVPTREILRVRASGAPSASAPRWSRRSALLKSTVTLSSILVGDVRGAMQPSPLAASAVCASSRLNLLASVRLAHAGTLLTPKHVVVDMFSVALLLLKPSPVQWPVWRARLIRKMHVVNCDSYAPSGGAYSSSKVSAEGTHWRRGSKPRLAAVYPMLNRWRAAAEYSDSKSRRIRGRVLHSAARLADDSRDVGGVFDVKRAVDASVCHPGLRLYAGNVPQIISANGAR